MGHQAWQWPPNKSQSNNKTTVRTLCVFAFVSFPSSLWFHFVHGPFFSHPLYASATTSSSTSAWEKQ